MRTLLVGSHAAKWHGVDLGRTPGDYDFFADTEFPEMMHGDNENGDKVDIFWDDALTQWLPEGHYGIAYPEELYTIKLSHAAWELRNGSWDKHMNDAMVLKAAGAQVDEDLYKLLYSVWERHHGKKQVNLDEESDEFFTDAVVRRFDHDSLHRSVAYSPGKPLYERVLKPGKTVAMDMAAVWAMPFDRQVALFREEIYVTALERLIIPSNYQYSPGRAYKWALRRTITSLTKGRSSRFIAENYDIFRQPDFDYVRHHQRNAHHLEMFKENK
ncbi:hypothetical protein ACFRAQ_34710 [Nocardia sp. NPDC056611]|uniref:DUF7275 domain-containing protein n=1 Tax=Nocardia sp. NPDC056611 TaxID=3345877 RepID=UPI0036724EC8